MMVEAILGLEPACVSALSDVVPTPDNGRWVGNARLDQVLFPSHTSVP